MDSSRFSHPLPLEALVLSLITTKADVLKRTVHDQILIIYTTVDMSTLNQLFLQVRINEQVVNPGEILESQHHLYENFVANAAYAKSTIAIYDCRQSNITSQPRTFFYQEAALPN